MARILGIFLMILVINKQTTSFEFFGIDIGIIKQAYDYINMAYQEGMNYANRDIIEQNSPAQQLRNIMTQIRTISQNLMNFENEQEDRLDILEKTISKNIGNRVDFGSVRSELLTQINQVNSRFKEGMEYNADGIYNNATLASFVQSVLLSNSKVEFLLYNIYKLVLPGVNTNVRKGLMTLAYDYAENNYQLLCDKNKSQQQHMYYVFMLLIRTHLRGFTTITQAYSIRSIYDNSSYAQEYKDSKEKLQNQLTNYIKVFIRDINSFSAEIRRCDVRNPVIDKNIFEMDGLFQVIANYELFIKEAIYPQVSMVCGNCEEISNNTRMQFMIHNCKTYSSIKGCLTSVDRVGYYAKRVLWFEGGSEFFGHENECKYGITEMSRLLSPGLFCWNDLCVCSVNTTDQTNFPDTDYSIILDPPRINKISLEPQYSDIANNMIVVGVKFILHDNAIHLQIQQSKVAKKRTVIEEAVWKPVDVDNNYETIDINYGMVFDKRNRLYLDDVMVHPDFLVTGVKLQISENNDGFELHVHSTKFDPETGVLSGPRKWFGPGEFPLNREDYKRNRTEITIVDPDDPTKAQVYHVDPQSNKFVQFQHTSIKKDAGYHTVPFFDGQPVESPLFPLSGVGLFYRQKDGFGGYIAPRLLTYNITWDIEASFNNWQRIEKKYKECDLKIPPNVKTVDEDATCESLEQIAKNHIDIQDGEEIDYRTHYTRHPSRSHHYSHSRRTQHDSTEDDAARNTIFKEH